VYSLKNTAKCAHSRYRSCPCSRERASESPEKVWTNLYLKHGRSVSNTVSAVSRQRISKILKYKHTILRLILFNCRRTRRPTREPGGLPQRKSETIWDDT